MATATGITYHDRPAKVVTGEFTADLGSINAAASEAITAAVPEAEVGDIVVISQQAALTDGLIVASAFVDSAGSITVEIENNHTGAIDQGSTVFSFALIRGRLNPPASG